MDAEIKKIAVFGAGGFGVEVATLIEQINLITKKWEMIGFFDDGKHALKFVNGYEIIGGVYELNHWDSELCVVLALGIPNTKKRVLSKINNPKVSYPVLIHPSAILGNNKYVKIGEGSIICAGTIITTNIMIGRHVILNLTCTVGHETKIGDYCSFMPTCNISGEVEIGESNFWGTGSKIINQRKVGNNVVVGAGAVIIDDVQDNVTVVGVPARVVKINEK